MSDDWPPIMSDDWPPVPSGEEEELIPVGLKRLGEFVGTFDYIPTWELPAVTYTIPGIDDVITMNLEHVRAKLRVHEIEWDDNGEVHLTARLEEYAVPEVRFHR